MSRSPSLDQHSMEKTGNENSAECEKTSVGNSNLSWEKENDVEEEEEESSDSEDEFRKKSLSEKLNELYQEEKQTSFHPKFASKLLNELVERDQMKHVVVNLFPGDYGFTISLDKDDNPISHHSYEDPILEFIDRGELHENIINIIQDYDVFYDGCVLAEIRDHRLCPPEPSNDSNYIMLKPTLKTLVEDMRHIIPANKFSIKDKLNAESRLICLTSEPLCLDPNPAVAIITNQVEYWKNTFHQPSLKRMAKRHSQAARNKRKRCNAPLLPPDFKHLEYIEKIEQLPEHSIPDKFYQFKQPLSNVNSFQSNPFLINENTFPVNAPVLYKFEKLSKPVICKNPLDSLCKLHYFENDSV